MHSYVSVHLLTGAQTRQNLYLILGRGKIFLSSPWHPDQLLCSPILLFSRYHGLFPGSKASRDAHLHVVPRFLHYPIGCRGMQREHFAFTFWFILKRKSVYILLPNQKLRLLTDGTYLFSKEALIWCWIFMQILLLWSKIKLFHFTWANVYLHLPYYLYCLNLT